jgi:hypothetical protein
VGTDCKSYQDTLVVAPTIISPAANASANSDVTFSWNALTPPTDVKYSYKVDWSLDSEFVNTSTADAGNLNTVTVQNFNPGAKVYWKVYVYSPMMSKKSSAVSFGIKLNQNANVITQLMAPKEGASNVPIKPSFQWSPIDGATGYDLQISDNPVFVNPIDSQTNLATNVWTLTKTLDFNKVYYWRVGTARVHHCCRSCSYYDCGTSSHRYATCPTGSNHYCYSAGEILRCQFRPVLQQRSRNESLSGCSSTSGREAR